MTALQCFNSATLQRCEARFNFAIRALRLFSRPMPQCTYRARDAQGGLVEGVLDCADRAVAIRQIESQHCIPIRIEVVDSAKPQGTKTDTPSPAQSKLRMHACAEVA